jgi:hypothetical protein
MPLLLKNGGVFLHIPKTGGSWVTKVLTEQKLVRANFGHKHATFDRVVFRENFEKSHKLIPCLVGRWVTKYLAPSQLCEEFMFCFVRHPLKWLESYWRFCKKLEWKDWGAVRSKTYWHPNAILNGLGDDNFEAFVWNVLKRRPGYVSELFSQYTQAGIDYIGRQENLVDDLLAALDRMNENYDEDFIRNYQRVNVSQTRRSEVRWSSRLREAALKTELSAMIHYGYLSSEEVRPWDFEPSPALSRIALPESDESARRRAA